MARDLGLTLAGGGNRALVQVGRCPEVAILATGSELKEAGTALQPGEIYESNRAGLGALVSAAGGVVRTLPLVSDDLGASRAALETAFKDSDVVVTRKLLTPVIAIPFATAPFAPTHTRRSSLPVRNT